MTESQINDLVAKFAERTLPKPAWTHTAHILVAFWHNWHYEFKEALGLVKNKIIAYNESVGTENTDSSGYHETLTVFWMILTRNYLSENDFSTIEAACSAFLESTNAVNTSPLTYYSRELLFSKAARREWVNGDIKPIVLAD